MEPYVDSGVLIKLYVREVNSLAAIEALRKYSSLRINPLHELEIRNTFRALEGRGAITPAQRAASEHTFDADIAAERLRRAAPDWSTLYFRAAELSREHTAATLARTPDILHIAAALSANAELFITADRRQLDAADRAALETLLLE